MNLEILKENADTGAGKRPLLFLHGMWHGAWCWQRYFMPYFRERGYTSFALSFRGHGKSAGNLADTGIADYAEDIGRAVAETGGSPVIIAHSMGGYALQLYMNEHEVGPCVFMASVPRKGIRAAAARAVKLFPEANLQAGDGSGMNSVLKSPGSFKALFLSHDVHEEVARECCVKTSAESPAAFAEMMRPAPQPGNTAKLQVLVLGAENDVLISSAETRALARAYHTESEIIQGVAHDMMLDSRWEAAADRVLEWLESGGHGDEKSCL